ncbi:MAG TPA: hypothetical protein VFR07_11085 [Mycobacteriales bacterium]|nr:hypothetical protein [Mycobacteriales bacterium]
MQVHVEGTRALRFDDGSPVRAASALAPLGRGWLVAQDDATHVAWLVDGAVRRLRVFPPVEGHDVFSEADGTKHLKPDLEAACRVDHSGRPGVLLLGGGATAARRRGVLVTGEDEPAVTVGSLDALYDAVARTLDIPDGQLNLEGVARNGAVLRWFQRGNLAAGVPSASVDVDLPALLDALIGRRDPATVPLRAPRRYAFPEVSGVGLAATDAVALPDGRVLLSAAAEDTANAIDDGAVVGAALALVDGEEVLDVAPLPEVDGVVQKVEGLGIEDLLPDGLRLRAVVDADDPLAPSVELTMRVSWSAPGSVRL